MSFVGLRVVRGPDWEHGNKHGKEGLVGTIVDVSRWKSDERFAKTIISVMTKQLRACSQKTVTVLWDCGKTGEYRIDNRPELRVSFVL